MSKNNKVLDNVQTIFLNNLKSKSSRKVEVLELLWLSALAIKRNIPPEIKTVFYILHDNKYNIKALKKMKPLMEESFYEKIEKISSKPYLNLISKESDKIEEAKRFISGELHGFLSVHIAVTGRIVTSICHDVAQDILSFWKEDEHTMSLLKSVFTNQELDQINKKQIGSFNQVIELLELKISNTIKGELIGSKENIDSIKHMLALEKEMKIKSTTSNNVYEIIEG